MKYKYITLLLFCSITSLSLKNPRSNNYDYYQADIFEALEELFSYNILDKEIFWSKVHVVTCKDPVWIDNPNLNMDEGKYVRHKTSGIGTEYRIICPNQKYYWIDKHSVRGIPGSRRRSFKEVWISKRKDFPLTIESSKNAAKFKNRKRNPMMIVDHQIKKEHFIDEINASGLNIVKPDYYTLMGSPDGWEKCSCDFSLSGKKRTVQSFTKVSEIIISPLFLDQKSRRWILDEKGDRLTGERHPGPEIVGAKLYKLGLELEYRYPLSKIEAIQYILLHEYLHSIDLDDHEYMENVLIDSIILLRKKKAFIQHNEKSVLLDLSPLQDWTSPKEVFLKTSIGSPSNLPDEW